MLTCSKKPFKHELGGGEYWENEALHTKIDGFGTRYNGDELAYMPFQACPDDDENGGLGLNNGQETPTGRPLSLSRVKAEVRLLRGLLYLHRNPGNKRTGKVRGIWPNDVLTRSSLNYSVSA